MNLTQSIMRLVMSKEKFKYTDKPNYEIHFIKNNCRKCVSYYRQKFGDKINNLFRRDEIHDDLMKLLLYLYGNVLISKAYGMT